MEAVGPDKNSDLTANNTHSQSSVWFPLNKSIATPDTSQNLENFMDSEFDRIHSATPIIRHVKTPLLQTKGTSCTCPSVGANYLADNIFWQEEFYFWGGKLNINKKPSTNYLIFYITMAMVHKTIFSL